MTILESSVITLRFFGDELIPEDISAALGVLPTQACRKGERIIGRHSGTIRIAKTGRWSIGTPRRAPEDLEGQIFEILDRLNDDLAVWKSLSRFTPELFCGIFMSTGNDGLILSPKALLALGERGIVLGLDIYKAAEADVEGTT